MCELKIKEIRKKLGVSQTKLAEMLGVHLKTVQNWEAGKVIPKTKYGILQSLLSNIPQKEINIKEQEKIQDPQPDDRVSEPSAAYNKDVELSLLRQRIADLERIISLQEETIKLLKKSQNI